MRKKSKQTASVVGMMVFNIVGSAGNTGIWCSECGDVVNEIEYRGDLSSGKLKLGGICKRCGEKINLSRNIGLDPDIFQMMCDH